MGRAERTDTERARVEPGCADRGDHRHLEGLGLRQRWQQSRQALREHALARAWRSNEQQAVGTRRRDGERALRRRLATHVREICRPGLGSDARADGRSEPRECRFAAHVCADFQQMARRTHALRRRLERLAGICDGHDELMAGLGRAGCGKR